MVGKVAPDELAEMLDGVEGGLPSLTEQGNEQTEGVLEDSGSELISDTQSKDELMASVEEVLSPITEGQLSVTYSENSHLVALLLFLLSNGVSALGGAFIANLWRMHRKAQNEYSE